MFIQQDLSHKFYVSLILRRSQLLMLKWHLNMFSCKHLINIKKLLKRFKTFNVKCWSACLQTTLQCYISVCVLLGWIGWTLRCKTSSFRDTSGEVAAADTLRRSQLKMNLQNKPSFILFIISFLCSRTRKLSLADKRGWPPQCCQHITLLPDNGTQKGDYTSPGVLIYTHSVLQLNSFP